MITIAGVKVLSLLASSKGAPPAVLYRAGFSVCADGAPNAYGPPTPGHPHGEGLDDLRNAGSKGNWYGIVTDNGEKHGTPIVQGPNDPFPGMYVSMTAYADKNYRRSDPKRYLDARLVPYIVVPPQLISLLDVKKGDVGMVFYDNAGELEIAPAIVGEVGPRAGIGEGSIALARTLNINANPKNGGLSKHAVEWLIFTGSTRGWPRTLDGVASQATALLYAFGGHERVTTALATL